ncbi:unnamed protein product [Effrenium voratum]|nr:unnamed protein product [Effrenium voratum]
MGDFDPTDYDGANIDPLNPEEEAEAPKGPQDVQQLKDAVLFVIDCSASSLEPLRPNGRCLMAEALATAAGVLKTKVITAPEDKVGVLLFGVREKQNPNNFEGIRLLHDLDRPTAHRIKQLEEEAKRPPKQMEERYGCGRAVPVSDVFWTSTTIFNLGANQSQFDCRIFLFTCNDSPAAPADEVQAARTRVQDLMDMGVEIEFFPLRFEDKDFAIDRFWGNLLPVDEADYVDRTALRLEQLERRIRMRIHRKRTLQRLAFYVCPGLEASVSVFVTMLEAKVPAPVYLLNENNKPLKAETKQICEQTGALLHPVDDIATFVEVANSRVFVSRGEAMEAKHLADPGIRLMGFKPQSCLKDHHRIFHAYFVYPNEKAVQGSAALLSALLRVLLDRKLLALCSYVARKNSEPVLVALLPQAEVEEEGEQLRPPGFHMIRLPWAEEIRSLSFPLPEGIPEIPDQLKAAARDVVEGLRLDDFAPGCAENPVLQRHYAAVQALALAEEQPEETLDVLQPDGATLEKKAPLLKAWKEAINACAPARLPKRAAGGGFEGEPAKRPKKEVPVPEGVEAMRALVHSGDAERLTVAVLKDWLKSQGVVNTGKKQDLLDRVRSLV